MHLFLSHSPEQQHTCRLILSSTLSIKSSGQVKISGAVRSATHTRVNSCRSRDSCGVVSTATSARRSSISMFVRQLLRHGSSARLVAGREFGGWRNEERVTNVRCEV